MASCAGVALGLGFGTSGAPVGSSGTVGRIDRLDGTVITCSAGVALGLGLGASGAPVGSSSAVGWVDGLDGAVIASGADLAVCQARSALRAPEAAGGTVDGRHSGIQVAVLAHWAGQAEGLGGLRLVIAHPTVDRGRGGSRWALGPHWAGSAGLGDGVAVVA
jgi:hypothetical protein